MTVVEIRKLLSDYTLVGVSALHARVLLDEIDRLRGVLKKINDIGPTCSHQGDLAKAVLAKEAL